MSLDSNAILTLNAYKEMAGIKTTDDKVDDVQLEHAINASSQSIEDYLGRGIITPSSAINEDFVGNGTYEYHVEHSRISSSATPVLYYWNGTSWTECSSTSYPYTYDSDKERCRIFFTSGDVFWEPMSENYRNWRINYKYGWAIASVPDAIRNACAVLVQRALKRIEKTGLTNEAFAESTNTYNLDTMITKDVAAMLAMYRRLSIG